MTATIKVEAQGRYLSLRVDNSIKEVEQVGAHFYPVLRTRKHKGASGALRSTIKCYTRESRKRALETFARLIIPENNLYVTLTYGQNYPKPLEAKKHLDTLGKRLRRAYDKAAIVWRLEFQERGAPHFHLIVLNERFIPANSLRVAWLEIIGKEYANNAGDKPKCPSMDIQRINTPKRVMYYVSKYVAKREDSFNNVAYLTDENGEFHSPGRFWGIIGRENLQFDLLITLRVPFNSRALWQFRFEMGRLWLPVRFMHKDKGFSLFSEQAHRLLLLYGEYARYIEP